MLTLHLKHEIGLTTPVPKDAPKTNSSSPFYFEAGYAGWAKRPSKPFPPPFFSPPSGSFSDPLSTHNRSVDRRPKVNGQMIRGVTVGDDALLVSDNLIGTNDGVGAWAQRERGHAPLWSRLILHFWALAAEKDGYGGESGEPDLVKYLSEAYEHTKEALSPPTEWFGTTTASAALLHYGEDKSTPRPVVYVTQLGDSKVMIVRPRDKRVLFETEEQWHYFDCPRQLGTNSPDTPEQNAVMTKVEVEEDDIVLAMSDGVTDNLWEHEITDTAVASLEGWHEKLKKGDLGSDVGEGGSLAEGMRYVAQEVVLAARKIAEDPFASSPFMERAVEEGLAIEGGKLDDISVVAALCRRRKG
ncbi:hypothetical protein BAUCODRAFT_532796 [Baudoinia panamericana UAMH 10762]|uniref:Protein phosphatase n=1 Tax=Baudoinia panamericana (strain UAMH 10762) TaxID=717646 RepID=M2N821_BAUPA|nr:uncharacterized protein BAUCODRAFT_532796 [Baudoinia panamericana UAMH 10762]EMC95244.1 hypothetical protein BAUCODRAFT_532796 [Baudoinia panamericana UAMH 10762]